MDELVRAIGLGVAGNMTGHLEQAGEASDFVGVEAEPEAPKGVFPFYVPGAAGHLGTFPLSSDTLRLPDDDAPVQLEPEVALICELRWGADRVEAVVPLEVAAWDDCSIRRPAPKISLKKNWGPATKGLAARRVPVRALEDFDGWRLASFLIRDGALHPYGVDSAVGGYSYFHDRLLDWLVDRLAHQEDSGPLERIRDHLETAGRPTRAVIAVGATRYTPFGETGFLRSGDEAIVVLYDGARHGADEVAEAVRAGADLGAASILRRRVCAPRRP